MKPALARTLEEALSDSAYRQAHFEALLEKEIRAAMNRTHRDTGWGRPRIRAIARIVVNNWRR